MGAHPPQRSKETPLKVRGSGFAPESTETETEEGPFGFGEVDSGFQTPGHTPAASELPGESDQHRFRVTERDHCVIPLA